MVSVRPGRWMGFGLGLILCFLLALEIEADTLSSADGTSTDIRPDAPHATAPGVSSRLGVDGIVIQLYGYKGSVAFGLEWLSMKEDIGLLLMVGRTVQNHSGREITQFSAKGEWRPFSRQPIKDRPPHPLTWIPMHTGLSLIAVDCRLSDCRQDRIFLELPDRYPDGYYGPTAVSGTLDMGTAFSLNHLVIYFEISSTIKGLDTYYRNPEFFREHYDFYGLAGISALGIGLKIRY